MKILIVAATRMEIAPLLSHIGCTGVSDKGIYYCVYKGLDISILITGVGMVATALYLGKNANTSYNIAINAGVCGSFNSNLETGTVVNIIGDCLSELGAEDGDRFLSLAELNLPGITNIVNGNLNCGYRIIDDLPKVNGITVNTVHGNEISIEKVIQKFHPITESMEGAAFMIACDDAGVPYVQIRAVSNYVERRNRELWNIPLAIKNLNDKLIEFLASLEYQKQ